MSKVCEITGKKVVVGRNVSHTKGHPTRTSRDFVPNLKNATFKSNALDSDITLQLATNTIRTINKYGDFDVFIINFRNNKLTPKAKLLKNKVEKALVKSGKLSEVKIVKEKKVKRTGARKVNGKGSK
ncbi:MAG: hypothetical protein Ta2D_00040 [Rickettsiales bacterium]|nr:MAG: hypothetical protein Ta2D_00040 [Rickettsiales bacterium]